MARLNINYQETIAVGNKIVSKGEEFNALLTTIKTLNNNLKDSWKGDDASSYTGEVENQAEIMQQLQATIVGIGNFLVEVGNTYEQVMEANRIGVK